MVLNSLSFCFSVKFLIFPSYLNEILAGYSNLGCRLFSFITLSMSCHSLLAWWVSTEKSAISAHMLRGSQIPKQWIQYLELPSHPLAMTYDEVKLILCLHHFPLQCHLTSNHNKDIYWLTFVCLALCQALGFLKLFHILPQKLKTQSGPTWKQ